MALGLVVAILLPLWNMIASGHRQLARIEDLVQFQNVAVRLLDAAARESYSFVRANAPGAPGHATGPWQSWQSRVVGTVRPGTAVKAWQTRSSPGDRNALILWVEVSWESADSAGRRIVYSTRLGRLLVRPEASLETEVPL